MAGVRKNDGSNMGVRKGESEKEEGVKRGNAILTAAIGRSKRTYEGTE